MTPEIATDARPGGPTAKRQPSAEGLGNQNPEEDPSAVGAALCDPERSREPALSEVKWRPAVLSTSQPREGERVVSSPVF